MNDPSASEHARVPHTQIDVWCTFYDEVRDDTLIAEYRRLLSDAERRQETKFVFARDRLRYLVTRALVRTVLSRYADVPPDEWRFARSPYNRPVIVNRCAHREGLTFNVSHANGLTAVGVARHRALGIDVEHTFSREAPLEIADRFFSGYETDSIKGAPPCCRPHRFFAHWTLKEAYMKARGLGLAIPLDQFGFRLTSPDQIEIAIDPAQNDLPDRWQFWQEVVRQGYLLAVCAERLSGRTDLVCMEAVPLVEARPLEHRRAAYDCPDGSGRKNVSHSSS